MCMRWPSSRRRRILKMLKSRSPPWRRKPSRHWTGESQLDLSIVNQMLLKHRAKLEAAQTAMEEAQTRMQAEQENAKATKAQVEELLSWAECFDKADIGTNT